MTLSTAPSSHATRPGDGTAPRTGEVRTLTGLRVVAAAWVVLFHFHFTGLDGVHAAVDALGPLVTAGALGVDLFFVLSGFVIAHTYLDKLGPALRVGATARFVWARACRIWPAYVVVFHLFGLWLIARLVWGADTQIAFQAVQPVVSLPEYLQQLVLVQLWDAPYFDGVSWVGPTWSVSAEWLAYLLFPLAALVFHRLRDLPVVLLAAGSLALMTPIAWAYLLTGSPYHPWSWAVRVLCGFGAGVLAQLVVRRLNGSAAGAAGWPSVRVRKWASAIVAALPLVVAAGLVAGELIGPGRGGAVLVGVPAAGGGARAGRPRPGDVAGPDVHGPRRPPVLQPLPGAHPDVRAVLDGAAALPGGAGPFDDHRARRRPGGPARDGARRGAGTPPRRGAGAAAPGPARPVRSAPRAPERSHRVHPGPRRPVPGDVAVGGAPPRRGGSSRRRLGQGSRTVVVTEYVQRVL